MNFTFDYYHNLEQVDLYLCNPDGRELFVVPGRDRHIAIRFNDLSDLTFSVDSKMILSSGELVDVESYDYIQTKRLIYATDIGWFQISGVDEHDDGVHKYKSVKCESLQAVFKNRGFFSEDRVYCMYNPDDPYDDGYDAGQEDAIPSVLGQLYRQLGIQQDISSYKEDAVAPYDDWTVTYVNQSFVYTGEGSVCRTFKERTTYGYDWMVHDVEDAFGVVVVFDFMYKTIQILAPEEATVKANVIYSFSNFMKDIDISESADDIVTVLNCSGGNCDITAVNPTGTNYICDFSYYMDKVNHRWMSDALIEKIEAWNVACAAEKAAYEGLVGDLRNLYHTATEKETNLQKLSIILSDLRTAQSKRSVIGDGKSGDLCGVVSVETVGVGETSIMDGSRFELTPFVGGVATVAYQSPPSYDAASKTWVFSGEYTTGTADSIVANNLSDDNISGRSYWYFVDGSDRMSYCKLQSAVRVNKEDSTTTHYCKGFERYIAYTYPAIDDETQATTYTDSVQEWIDLRESQVDALNIELYGYTRPLNGYQYDDKGEIINPTSGSIYGRINTKNGEISAISRRLNILSYFSDTPELLRELNCYWIEGDYTNENIAVLDETTPEEEIDLANELLAAGCIELSKVCQPHYSFSINSDDVAKQYEFRNQMRELTLGRVITIEKEEGVWYYPALLEISMSLDDSDEFNMVFANALRLDDWGYTYADLISDASTTSRQVNANWQEILAYSRDRVSTEPLIKNPLDATLRAAFSNMVNQEFVVDSNGILGRKKLSDESDKFEDEQVRMINNLLIFTDDNWRTAKTALGKITYMDGDKSVTSYGLIAETLVGSLIMGEALKINNADASISIDKDGIVIKNANTQEIIFRVTTSGQLLVKNYATMSNLNTGLASIEAMVDDESSRIDLLTERVSNDEVRTSASIKQLSDDLKAEIESRVEFESETNKSIAKVTQTASDNGASITDLVKFTNDKADALAKVDTRVTATEARITELLTFKTDTSGALVRIEKKADDNGASITDLVEFETESKNNVAELQRIANEHETSISAKVSETYGSQTSSFGWSLKSNGFYVYSNASTVLEITSIGLQVTGAIYATEGEFLGTVKAKKFELLDDAAVPAGKVNGLADVAKSGNYNDLINKPYIPPSLNDLGIDPDSIICKEDVKQDTKTDIYGNSYTETTVGDKKYITYDLRDYVVFGQSRGTDTTGSKYFCVSSEGLLTARNALIYGTVYATDGEFFGKITATSGYIGGFEINPTNISGGTIGSSGGIYLGTSNWQGTVAGKALNWRLTVGSNFGVTPAGSLYAKNANISGKISVEDNITFDSGARLVGSGTNILTAEVSTFQVSGELRVSDARGIAVGSSYTGQDADVSVEVYDGLLYSTKTLKFKRGILVSVS